MVACLGWTLKSSAEGWPSAGGRFLKRDVARLVRHPARGFWKPVGAEPSVRDAGRLTGTNALARCITAQASSKTVSSHECSAGVGIRSGG